MAAYDVIVLGAGTMGSAAAAELSRRGLRVLLLEQFSLVHARGAHHGHSRVFRVAYHEHPDYVPLLKRAFELWHAMNRASGQAIFHQTGALYAGPAGCETVEGARRSARLHGLALDSPSRDPIAARLPQLRLPDGWDTAWEPTAGFVVPELAVGAMLNAALAHGAVVHGHEPALEWAADTDGVRVRTIRGEHRARVLVITAGAWASKLLRDLGVALRVTRQVLAWYWPRKPELFEPGRHPVWAFENERHELHYGFPMQASNPGVKAALHRPGRATDPDAVVRDPLPGDEEETRPAIERYFPDAAGPLLSLLTCLYTNSPDGHFIVDTHPRHANVHFACGFSGHGFKFAPVMGEVLADLAMGRPPALPISFLGLVRFAR